MTEEESSRRIVVSRRTFAIWRIMGGPLGEPDEVLEMINGEIGVLRYIAAEHPKQAATASELIKRYETLITEHKLRSGRSQSQAP